MAESGTARHASVAPMLTTLICTIALAAPRQAIDGIKPVLEGTREYAQAFAKYANDNPATVSTPDWFMVGYFSTRGKVLASLVNTKYTAAHAGICGTMLGLYDQEVTAAFKAGADRIIKGSKDFDSFTKEEKDAIAKALANEKSPIYPFIPARKMIPWDYFAGAHLGTLSAYATAWNISPKEKTLLRWIDDSLKACVEHGAKTDHVRKDISDQLKAFSKWQGKTLDEATMREIGGQLARTLRASIPEKYRWEIK